MAKILVCYIKIVLEALNWFEANYVVQFILINFFMLTKMYFIVTNVQV